MDRYLDRHAWRRIFLSLVWAGLVVVGLLGENLRARWGIIDDSYIAVLLGPSENFTVSDLMALWVNHKEVGNPPLDFPRYRPAYYLLFSSEAYLWGNCPPLWYASRLFIFGLSLALFWAILWRWLGSLAACLVLLFLLTYPFWKGVWCQLGPSEIYACLGTALYLGAAERLGRYFRSDTNTFWVWRLGAWSQLFLGAFVAFGSKENFLILLPATWLLAGWLIWRKKLDAIGLATTFLLTLVGLGIGIIVWLSLKNIGKDLHAQEVNPWQRLQLLTGFAHMVKHRPESKAILAGVVGVAGLGFYAWRTGRGSVVLGVVRQGGLVLLGLGLLVASQFLFYNGQWPRGNRYDFPGLLALPLMGITVALMVLALLDRLGKKGQTWPRAAFLALLAGCVVSRGFEALREGARANAEKTIHFCRSIENIVFHLQQEPDRPVVFVSHQAQDSEPVGSVRRFLRWQGVDNSFYLRLEGYQAEGVDSPRYRPLARLLQEYSEKGDYAELTREFSRLPRECFEPLPQMSNKKPAFEIHFFKGLKLQLRVPSNPDLS